MMMPGYRIQFLFYFCVLLLRRHNAVPRGTDVSSVGERDFFLG